VAVVLLCAAVCLLAAAPFGHALSRFLLGRMPAVPVEYARYRPNQHPAVLDAENVIAGAYRDLAYLYPDPNPTVRR